MKMTVLSLGLVTAAAKAAIVNVQWEPSDPPPAYNILWEKTAGEPRQRAFVEGSATSAGADFDAGEHTVYVTAVNELGYLAEPSNEVTFRVVRVILEASQDGTTWQAVGEYTALMLSREFFQTRAVFPTP
jgi:hypothetical protein